ncbi:hypothetical protein Q1695_003170 [Nippostrongylus brasiliensis]|nr:hypothetical protein Q1695_003170 [Nippostrongylus brasiliensis]
MSFRKRWIRTGKVLSTHDLLLVIGVSLLFSFHHVIISKLSRLLISFMKKKTSPEVLQLGNETERLLNKTLEQYDAAVAEDNKRQSSPAKVETTIKVLAQAVGFVLLHVVSGIYALCIPSVSLWPLNAVLRFPSVWSSGECGGEDSTLTPVSMFVFIYGIIFTIRVLIYR